MLPGADGFTIARTLRDAGRYTPILMLTARSRPEDILEGIEAGADDYLPKPFDLNILLVRLKSLFRRMAWQKESPAANPLPDPQPASPEPELPNTTDAPPPPIPTPEYAFNHRTIRFDQLELVAPNRLTHLTLMEADLLRYLTDRPDQIVSRKEILEQVWRVHEDTDTRAIDNFIRPPPPLHRRRSRQPPTPHHRPRHRLPLPPRTVELLPFGDFRQSLRLHPAPPPVAALHRAPPAPPPSSCPSDPGAANPIRRRPGT